MPNKSDDIVSNISDEDLKEITETLGQSGEKPEASSSEAKQTTAEAPTEGTETAVGSSEKPASEGEKTPAEGLIEPKVRETSKTVPYSRFKEVNDQLRQLKAELEQSSSLDSRRELEENPEVVSDWDKYFENLAKTKVKEVLEPIVEELDKRTEEEQINDILEKSPELKPYRKEIEAYGEQTNLTYEDIALLVRSKHSKEPSFGEVQQSQQEAREAETGGVSNSAAKRKEISSTDLKNIPTEDLEKLVDQMKSV